MIEELIREFLNQGVDLAFDGHNQEEFVKMVKRGYVRALPREEREKEGLWEKIWWFQRLQQLLEEENVSVTEALVNGWNWFIDVEQWPSKHCNSPEYPEMWAKLSGDRQHRFLDEFDINQDNTTTWMSNLSSMEFCCEMAAEEEGLGLQREFEAAGIELKLNGPRRAEEALTDGSWCPICNEAYYPESDDEMAHGPVRLDCGHVFEWRCVAESIRRDLKCPKCRVPLSPNTAEVLLESCENVLIWLEPAVELMNSIGSQDFVGKLMLIFEPADEIRKRLKCWLPRASSIGQDLGNLADLGMYLARERFVAVLEGDVLNYKNAMIDQAQPTAQ